MGHFWKSTAPTKVSMLDNLGHHGLIWGSIWSKMAPNSPLSWPQLGRSQSNFSSTWGDMAPTDLNLSPCSEDVATFFSVCDRQDSCLRPIEPTMLQALRGWVDGSLFSGPCSRVEFMLRSTSPQVEPKQTQVASCWAQLQLKTRPNGPMLGLTWAKL